MARPPSTYEGRITMGYDIFFTDEIACVKLYTISLFGWLILSWFIKFENLSLSSHRSIDSNDVPKILIPSLLSFSDNFKGVCPPSWTITPNKSLCEFSERQISRTDSRSNGSKYNLSEISKSVETVSGLQLTMIDSIFNSRIANDEWTQQ